MSALNPHHPLVEHPIVAAAQHTVSPLTGTLTIFFLHKSWQWPSAMATLRAGALLRAAGELPPLWPALRAQAGGVVAVTAAAAGSFLFWRSLVAPRSPPPPLPTRLDELYGAAEAPRAAAALLAWPTSAPIEAGLRALRETTGAPWWATIAMATLGLRAALAPAQAALLRNSLRMKLLLPELARAGVSLADGTASHAVRLASARKLFATLRGAGASPWQGALLFPLLMPPVILSLFAAVHDLCLAEPAMATEGALWFRDLVAPDATSLLPILSNLSWLWQVEVGAGRHYQAAPGVRLAVRVVAAATVPLAATLPAGVFVFWLTSNAFALTRGYVLRLPAVRRRLGIPLQSHIDALPHLPAWRGA